MFIFASRKMHNLIKKIKMQKSKVQEDQKNLDLYLELKNFQQNVII